MSYAVIACACLLRVTFNAYVMHLASDSFLVYPNLSKLGLGLVVTAWHPHSTSISLAKLSPLGLVSPMRTIAHGSHGLLSRRPLEQHHHHVLSGVWTLQLRPHQTR